MVPKTESRRISLITFKGAIIFYFFFYENFVEDFIYKRSMRDRELNEYLSKTKGLLSVFCGQMALWGSRETVK